MNLRSKGLTALLLIGAALSLILPVGTLFMGDGSFTWHMTQPSTYAMLAEIAILLVLFIALCFFVPNINAHLTAAAGICLVFCWLHVTFLPMLVSGLYLTYLVLLGHFARTRAFRAAVSHGIFADFLLGCGLVLAEFCLLSVFKVGGIPVLRNLSIIQGGLLLVWMFFDVYRKRMAGAQKPVMEALPERGSIFGKLSRGEWLLLSFTVVMVLIQIGKMNITLDFDTLWYGVRSEYILDFGNGIYENPGMVGMAYVYSKGLEVLALPLSDLDSHSYLLFFNVWLTVLGFMAVYRIARFYMKRRYALLSVAFISAVPGIMNMSISAKPDIITWLLQLIMVVYLLCYIDSIDKADVHGGHSRGDGFRYQVKYLILAAGAYLLSLTMKPTSLVFSTAVFGMAGLYLIVTRTLSLKAPLRHWLLLLPAGVGLIGIWARTMMITGMPVTSVFTSIFAKLGFQIKYPFATSALPQNWQDESHIQVLFRRLYQMLLAPEGKDMGHVVIAWGSSLLFFLLTCLLVYFLAPGGKGRERTPVTSFAHVLFWPFLAVNLVSLVMLYQVDGNYFILLYTAVILFSCRALSALPKGLLQKTALGLMIPVLTLNVLVCAVSNWAWALGFSEIKLQNSGRVNHREMQHKEMIAAGNAEIWNILAADPGTRVIAFGEHPFSLNFPCMVQTYKDITNPWGNVELVNTPGAFEAYMEYAGAEYIYVEAGYVGEDSWSWSYGLLKDLLAGGALGDLYFENGNVLMRVNAGQRIGKAFKEISGNPQENLALFLANYKTAEQVSKQTD